MSIRRTLRRWLSHPDKGAETAATGAERSWSQTLTDINATLASLGAHTEDDFLSLGNNLQSYYTRAQTMAALSHEIVELMTGEEIQTAGTDLHSSLQELHDYLEDSSAQFSKMGTTFQHYMREISSITSGLESFQMLALNLNILGFLTRVENAHLANTNSGFSALTDDVRKLSDSIKEKASSIRASCETISAGVSAALDRAIDCDRTHNAAARTIQAKSADSERLLTERYGLSVAAARQIDRNIAQIAGDISTIVMSLQFHDITRQQIQHVQTVLEHLHAKLREPGTPSERQAALVGDSLELQVAQIAQSHREFVTAVNTVMENLRALAGNVDGIMSEIGQVAWVTDQDGISTMKAIQQGFETIIDHIMVMAELQRDLNTAAQDVSAMVTHMSSFVQDINTLGLNLEFLALNARIKAAHLGEEGVALDTISGSIYELSHSTRDNTAALSDILKRLSDLSSDFTRELKAREDRQAKDIQTVMNELVELTGIMTAISERVEVKTSELSRLGRALIQDINATVGGIDVHDRVAVVLDEATSLMQQTVEEARRFCPQGWADTARQFLGGIDLIYTMHSERRIHAMHVDKQTAPDEAEKEEGSNIEFF